MPAPWLEVRAAKKHSGCNTHNDAQSPGPLQRVNSRYLLVVELCLRVEIRNRTTFDMKRSFQWAFWDRQSVRRSCPAGTGSASKRHRTPESAPANVAQRSVSWRKNLPLCMPPDAEKRRLEGMTHPGTCLPNRFLGFLSHCVATILRESWAIHLKLRLCHATTQWPAITREVDDDWSEDLRRREQGESDRERRERA